MDLELLDQYQKKSKDLSVEGHIKFALQTLLTQFNDKKKGQRILAKKMGIHEKTLIRLLQNENKASYQTVFKIYRVLYNEFNDARLLEIVPPEIREFLLKFNVQELNLNFESNYNADLELQKNPIVAEIYVMAGTGPIDIDQIEYRFGKYGLDLVSKMTDKKLLNEIHRGVFIPGLNRPIFDGQTILSVGKALIDSHAKPSNGEETDKNFISFYAEGLNEETYLKWIQIDEEAFKKKAQLANIDKNKGSFRAFTFMISETIDYKDLQ